MKKIKRYQDPDNENEIVVVHKEEQSAPRIAVAVLLLMMGILTVGQQFYFSGQRNSDIQRQNEINERLISGLQEQVNTGRGQRQALQRLVTGLISAQTEEERLNLLRQYNAETGGNATLPPAPPQTFGPSSYLLPDTLGQNALYLAPAKPGTSALPVAPAGPTHPSRGPLAPLMFLP